MKNNSLVKALYLILLPVALISILLLLGKINSASKLSYALAREPIKLPVSSVSTQYPAYRASIQAKVGDTKNSPTVTNSSQGEAAQSSRQSSSSSSQFNSQSGTSTGTADVTHDSTTGNNPDASKASGLQQVQPANRPAPQENNNYKESELLVVFKPGVSDEQISAINALHHTAILSTLDLGGASRVWYHLRITDGTPAKDVLASYQSLPEVEQAELNYLCKIPEDESPVPIDSSLSATP